MRSAVLLGGDVRLKIHPFRRLALGAGYHVTHFSQILSASGQVDLSNSISNTQAKFDHATLHGLSLFLTLSL